MKYFSKGKWTLETRCDPLEPIRAYTLCEHISESLVDESDFSVAIALTKKEPEILFEIYDENDGAARISMTLSDLMHRLDFKEDEWLYESEEEEC